MDSINNNFQVPISPLSFQQENSPTPQAQLPGQEVFDCASELYAWVLSKDAQPKEHMAVYQAFSQIMCIAQRSFSGGNYLTKSESTPAYNRLLQLGQELYEGGKSYEEISAALELVQRDLTENCPKAVLNVHVTQAEYLLCIRPEEGAAEMQEAFRATLEQIKQKITPELPDLNASAMAQSLNAAIQDANLSPTERLEKINAAIRDWLI